VTGSNTGDIQKGVETLDDWDRMSARHQHEDDQAQRDRDPEFTVDDLMRISGQSRAKVCAWLLEVNIGRTVLRDRPQGGRGKVKMVRYSELKRFAAELSWFPLNEEES
jgi:hypothetical protein